MIRHLPYLDDEQWYVIDVDHGEKEGRPHWQHRDVHLHGPNTQATAEWNVLGRHAFGLGFEAGRNGGESDVGLSVYLGPLASVRLRLRTPWTKWARVRGRGDGWYHPRHTGVVLFPHKGCLMRAQWDSASDGGKELRREWSLTSWKILGRTRTETTKGDSGVARVPLPEGVYLGTWEQEMHVQRYTRWPGRLRDLIRGPRRHTWVNLSIEGGIPVEGKGENSYDCGMDGLFGCSGRTLEEAIGNAVTHVLRDRRRYGGPHNLERPMTVRELSQ